MQYVVKMVMLIRKSVITVTPHPKIYHNLVIMQYLLTMSYVTHLLDHEAEYVLVLIVAFESQEYR